MKKNILEVCEAYGGGVKRQVDYIKQYVDDSLYSLTVLVSSGRGAKIEPDCIVDDRLSMFIKKPWKFIPLVRRVHRLIEAKRIDLVHAHSTVAGIFMVIYKIIYHDKVSVIFTPHAYFSEIDRGRIKTQLVIFIERFMSRFFEKIIHVSEEEQNYALNKNLVSKDKCVIINNGVPKPMIVKKKHSGTIFINVARCSFQKDPQLFIEIAKEVIQFIPDSEFIWVGDGPLLKECRAQVVRDKMSGKIKFMGYSDNPYRFLAQSDIYISSSRYEGLPFSVLEALSCGLPLILTDIIGHEELIQDNGMLLDDKRIEENLAKTIKDIVVNKDTLGEMSYSLYIQKFSIDKMISGIEKVYAYT